MASDRIVIVGAGPAGLAAAERLAEAGVAAELHDAMPSVARKFLLAGKSGLNLTHAEPFGSFAGRYGAASARLRPALDAFGPEAVRTWAEGLGVPLFTGTSGRVFPKAMKASPLLRAWLRRLAARGVTIHTRHRWTGFAGDGALRFVTPEGERHVRAAATLLALGGASWPRLGSDAAWVPILQAAGVPIAPLKPANCGFDAAWSEVMRTRFAGEAVKSVTAGVPGAIDGGETVAGEFVVTAEGVEGGLIYRHSAALRAAIEAEGEAILRLDLAPDRSAERLVYALARQSPKQSFVNRLRRATGLTGVKAALLREGAPGAWNGAPEAVAAAIKALPLRLLRPRPVAEAISTAGGIGLDGLDEHFMIRMLPGVFAAGEMLDWEAPTGGYLLTACLATGRAAADGILNFAGKDASEPSRGVIMPASATR